MRRELLYAMPVAGMLAFPILRKRIAPGVEAVVYTAKKTIKPGETSTFTVYFQNKGEQSTTVNWQAIPVWDNTEQPAIASGTFDIGGGETKSVTGTFTPSCDLQDKDVDLIINYWYKIDETTITNEVSYKEKYGIYPWHVSRVSVELSIFDISVTPSEVKPGDTISYSFKVRNDSVCPISNLRVLMTAVEEVSGAEVELLYREGIYLDAGETKTFSDSQTTSEDWPRGYYDVLIKTWVGETFIKAATKDRAFKIVSPPDIEITSIEVS